MQGFEVLQAICTWSGLLVVNSGTLLGGIYLLLEPAGWYSWVSDTHPMGGIVIQGWNEERFPHKKTSFKMMLESFWPGEAFSSVWPSLPHDHPHIHPMITPLPWHPCRCNHTAPHLHERQRLSGSAGSSGFLLWRQYFTGESCLISCFRAKERPFSIQPEHRFERCEIVDLSPFGAEHCGIKWYRQVLEVVSVETQSFLFEFGVLWRNKKFMYWQCSILVPNEVDLLTLQLAQQQSSSAWSQS